MNITYFSQLISVVIKTVYNHSKQVLQKQYCECGRGAIHESVSKLC